MANTYTWKISQCDRILESGVVTTLWWHVNAVTDDGLHEASTYGSVGLEAPESDSMIAYESLTEAQCISWAQEKIGGADRIAEILAALDARLAEKRSPTIGRGIPWS